MSEKNSFKPTEPVVFRIRIPKEKKWWNVLGYLGNEASAQEEPVKVDLIDPYGVPAGIFPEIRIEGDEAVITVPSENLQPGRYTLKISAGEGDALVRIEQDFSWGVLALNANKSVYAPGETAKLAFAVLDNKGKMLCDARLELTVKNINTGDADILSTDNGGIRVNYGVCGLYDYTDKPDYGAEYKIKSTGKYELVLKADTSNGLYEITDGFEVRDFVPFDVERTGPTRIYPPETYPVKINIKANEDFSGNIVETVPMEFSIFNFQFPPASTSEAGQANNFQYLISNIQTFASGTEQKIIIRDMKLNKGEEFSFSYDFKAPEISPEFYLLGPLEFHKNGVPGEARPASELVFGEARPASELVFGEARQWQIASDAVFTVLAGEPNDGTGAITIDLPASIAADDILLLFIETENEAVSVSSAGSCATWTQASSSPQGTGTASAADAVRLTVFWCRYSSGSTGPTITDSGDHQLAAIIAVRGAVTAGNPIEASAGGVEAGNTDTSGSITGTTTLTSYALVIAAMATALPDSAGNDNFDSWTNANLDSITEALDVYIRAGTGGGLGIAYGEKSAPGATGATAVTLGTASAKAFMTLAVKRQEISVSGGCFTDDTEGTACTDDGGDAIKVAVNGVVQGGADTTVDGSWSFQIPLPPSGVIMVFFRDGQTTEAKECTTVTKYDGSGNVDLVKMYESMLVIGTDTGSANSAQTITIADLDTASNGYENSDDEDVLFDVTAGDDLTVDAESTHAETLYVIGSNIFDPGGDTYTLNLKSEGTISAGGNALDILGNFTNSGIFTSVSGTTTLDGTSAQTITGDFSGTSYFYNLAVGNGSDSTAASFSAADVDVKNILTVFTSATLNAGSGTWTLYAVGKPFVRNGTFDGQTSTFVYDTDATTTITAADYYSLQAIAVPGASGFESCGDDITFNYLGNQVTYGTLSVGDQCFMDRNLGASQAATAYNDTASYGDYFQWGRLDDGHQVSDSGTTATLSTTDRPGHDDFITNGVADYDWHTNATMNDNLWATSSGAINNPCPAGWHVPSRTQWDSAMITLGLKTCSSDCLNAMANSSLKIPAAGYRSRSSGALNLQGTQGDYWSSSPNSTDASLLTFSSTVVNPAFNNSRALGFSVRCLLD